jgi:integrase
MARLNLMSWVAGSRRWLKEYKGKKYAISCRQLGTPPTKEGSYQQANEWWRAKQAEVDGYALLPALPKPGEPGVVTRLLEAWHGGPFQSQEEAAAALADLMAYYADKPLPAEVRQAVLGPGEVKRLELQANALLDGPPAPTDGTLAAQVERWVTTHQAQVAAGNMTPDRADGNRIALYHFRDWLGSVAVADIDAAKLHDFYVWCLAKVEQRQADPKAGWSAEYAKRVFATARTFVRFLWEGGLIELPRNIDSKGFRFGNGAKAVKTWTPDEVRMVIQEASGKLKLCLLLMANCGYRQTDVSDLLDTEVDWQAGTITRKRSKTATHENVPTVCYRLWPVTFQLLQQYRSGTDRVLLTESGKPYVRKELVNGRLVKSDNIASNFSHLRKRLAFRKSMNLLRKTSASLLESHHTYGRLANLFLGLAPRSIKDRHYAAPPQALLDEAVAWLQMALGLA